VYPGLLTHVINTLIAMIRGNWNANHWYILRLWPARRRKHF